jgi:precorrin isomerase
MYHNDVLALAKRKASDSARVQVLIEHAARAQNIIVAGNAPCALGRLVASHVVPAYPNNFDSPARILADIHKLAGTGRVRRRSVC